MGSLTTLPSMVLGAGIALGLSSSVAGAAGPKQQVARRNYMVQREIVDAGITNPRVVEALRATPRHEFVPMALRKQAYFDMALPIGAGQTISPPFVVALMTQELDPQPTDKVLEIGTGSGYQAAVLSPLVAEVYSIEIVESLGRKAAKRLQRLGYHNVQTRIGDGYGGWPEHAPFDKIIVTCSPEKVPSPLVEQLVDGGRMIVPLGERFQQRLYVFEKKRGELQRRALRSTFFVPMTGAAEDRRQTFPDPVRPQLVGGSFEQPAAADGAPPAWYYVRQAAVEQDEHAPDGNHCLVFTNRTPGRRSHALQAFGVDGQEVRTLEVACWVRAEQLRPGPTPDQQPALMIEFYDSNRGLVGQAHLGPWRGAFPWRAEHDRLPVPASARLAVIAIGLFGGTGRIAFDQVRVAAANKPSN